MSMVIFCFCSKPLKQRSSGSKPPMIVLTIGDEGNQSVYPALKPTTCQRPAPQQTASSLTRREWRRHGFWKARTSSGLRAIEPNLKSLNDYLFTNRLSTTTIPDNIIHYVFNSRAKRLRPCVFFLVCRLLNYQGQHLVPIAAVSEYVHTASILHDDVVDNTTIRRGRPTVHSRWGDETSILVGDLIYAQASQLMVATEKLDIVATFAKAIQLMSEGELLQLDNLYNVEITEQIWLQIIRYKTAELLGATCRAAALLADSDVNTCNSLYEFGCQIGTSFQMIDDALDFCGQEQQLGKQTLIDVANGKITLPIILLYQQGDHCYRQKLHSIINNPTTGDLQWLKTQAEQRSTIEATRQRAIEVAQLAGKQLDIFPPSSAKDDLLELNELLLTRNA